MASIRYTVTDMMGLHARIAGELVKRLQTYERLTIKLQAGGREADAKRLMAVMALAVKQGQEIILQLDGPDDAEAAQEIEQFLKERAL